MGFRCPVCKKDFGRDEKLFERHMKSHEEKPQRQKPVNLCDFERAVLDGRLDIWVNQNGMVIIENRKAKSRIELETTKDMWGKRCKGANEDE